MINQGIQNLYSYLTAANRITRIEAEGKKNSLSKFFVDYQNITGINLTFNTDGIVLLDDDANKWSLELRIYISDVTNFPTQYKNLLTTNTRFEEKYKAFAARLNNNDLIMDLIRTGLRI